MTRHYEHDRCPVVTHLLPAHSSKVTILGMSSDVISERCRKCVEDVVAKAQVLSEHIALPQTRVTLALEGKFEFVDKETYGEYIQARCDAPSRSHSARASYPSVQGAQESKSGDFYGSEETSATDQGPSVVYES